MFSKKVKIVMLIFIITLTLFIVTNVCAEAYIIYKQQVKSDKEFSNIQQSAYGILK